MCKLDEYKIYTIRKGEVKKKVGTGEFRTDNQLSAQLRKLLIRRKPKRLFKNI